jgi:hypothetical protein
MRQAFQLPIRLRSSEASSWLDQASQALSTSIEEKLGEAETRRRAVYEARRDLQLSEYWYVQSVSSRDILSYVPFHDIASASAYQGPTVHLKDHRRGRDDSASARQLLLDLSIDFNASAISLLGWPNKHRDSCHSRQKCGRLCTPISSKWEKITQD